MHAIDTIHSAVTLRNGVSMPTLGLGVFKAGSAAPCIDAVFCALQQGYRHIDTAAIYRNERQVGQGLAKWRAEGHGEGSAFVTTKLWNKDHSYEAALSAFERSRQALGLEVVDQYLIHWPVSGLRLEAWRALERLYEHGVCRSIGVSNFTVRHLEELAQHARVMPHVNQVELHPLLPQPELVQWCRRHDIQTVAYSPLTKARFLDDPVVLEAAGLAQKTPAQVLLRWGLEQGHVVLPKSTHPERIAQNAAIFDFELTAKVRRLLESLAQRGERTAWDPTDVV